MHSTSGSTRHHSSAGATKSTKGGIDNPRGATKIAATDSNPNCDHSSTMRATTATQAHRREASARRREAPGHNYRALVGTKAVATSCHLRRELASQIHRTCANQE